MWEVLRVAGTRSKKGNGRLGRTGLRPFHSLSLVQFSVVLFIMGALVAMAIPVWSNIRQNAYESQASQNMELGKDAVEKFWVSQGEKEGSYEGLTAFYVDSNEPGVICTETALADLENLGLDQIPLDYFSSILILRDGDAPVDEIAIATISHDGKVLYTCFKKADITESGRFAYSELASETGGLLHASRGTGISTE
jgi:type II secretory pathway pseudopilin PulG